jgi:hypothetical protein
VSYLALDPARFAGQVVGSGQCVAFVQVSSGAPRTAEWKQGVSVKASDLPTGTAIATFLDGVYPNHSTGNHAAIYASQDESGIQVWDQWLGQPVHARTIRFKGGTAPDSNDGDTFSVIE